MTENTLKKTAVLHLVRHVLSLECTKPTEAQPQLLLPETYEDLRYGIFLYRILSYIAPQSFPDAMEMAEQSQASRMNKIVRKENLISLVRHMNDYAHQALGAPDTLNLNHLINAEVIANSPLLSGECNGEIEHDRGLLYLIELTDIFIVMVVLSGDSTIMQAVKSLQRTDQVVLSNAAKACITKHALRPRRRSEVSASITTHHSGLNQSVVSSHDGISSRNTLLLPVPQEDSIQSAQVQQLRRELDDSNTRVTELDSMLELTLTEKQEWEARYKKLMAEAEQRRATFAGEEHLRQLLAKREETVKILTTAVEEYSKKIAAFKEATTLQESALSAMKRKLKQTEEELIKKSAERRDALEKLALVEGRLTDQINARSDLEREVEDLRAELTVFRVQYHDNADDSDCRLNRSFGSVNSVDRVVMLENELDEVRSQKEAAERLLHVFQRQVASFPSEGFKPDAAIEALKAQVRHAEKEKEDLRNQLAVTVARLEEAQNRWKVGGGQSVIGSESGSFMTGGKSGEKNVDGITTLEATESVGPLSRRRESSDGLRREQAVLTSTVLLLGYRNLMLQQRALLENNGLESVRSEEVEAERERHRGTGSFLTQHRWEVEEGLVRSVLNRSGWSH